MTSRKSQAESGVRLPSPPPDFTGRRHELEWLRERLDAFPVLLVCGLPGSGKSCLLAALARELAPTRPVRFVDCKDERSPQFALQEARSAGAILFADGLESLGRESA